MLECLGEVDKMKKNDIILLIGILGIASIMFFGFSLFQKEAEEILITVDGQEYGRYKLSEDAEIPINDTNYLIIRDGVADMIEASCPDHICVNQKEISKSGETIVCLPNKVIVEIKNAESTELDAVTN
jgi:hypothetical protein